MATQLGKPRRRRRRQQRQRNAERWHAHRSHLALQHLLSGDVVHRSLALAVAGRLGLGVGLGVGKAEAEHLKSIDRLSYCRSVRLGNANTPCMGAAAGGRSLPRRRRLGGGRSRASIRHTTSGRFYGSSGIAFNIWKLPWLEARERLARSVLPGGRCYWHSFGRRHLIDHGRRQAQRRPNRAVRDRRP